MGNVFQNHGTGFSHDGDFCIDQKLVPSSVTITYVASGVTDAIDVTLTVVNANGVAITGIFALEVWVSDTATGVVLTSTAASGAMTSGALGAVTATHTAKKHVLFATSGSGAGILRLVDSANTAGEYFCCRHPVTGQIITGPATVATDYEGGV